MNNSLPAYLTELPREPLETWGERHRQQLRDAIIAHPEDELSLIQQLMIWTSMIALYNDETIRLGLRVLELDKEKEYYSETYFVLARIYAFKKEISKAIEFYNKSIEEDSRGYGWQAITELAKLFEEQGDVGNAHKTYELLDNGVIEDGKEKMYRYKGYLYLENNEWEKAIECFDKAIACCMEYEWMVHRIGNTFLSPGIDDHIFEIFKERLNSSDEKDYANCHLAVMYQDRGDYYMAMHHYTEAIKLNPDIAEAYNNMALLALEHEGDLNESEALLNKAMAALERRKITEPQYAGSNEWLISLFYLNLSRVYKTMTDFEKAARYKSKFVERMGFTILEDDDDNDSGEEEFL